MIYDFVVAVFEDPISFSVFWEYASLNATRINTDSVKQITDFDGFLLLL